MQVVSIKCNLREVISSLKQSHRDEALIQLAQSIVDSMPDDEEINLSRHIKGHVDKQGWITVEESASEKAVISALSKLNSKSKHSCLVYQRKMIQYNELLNEIAKIRKFSGNTEIPLETHHSLQDRCYWTLVRLWLQCRTPLIYLGFFFSCVFSGLTLGSELTTILFNLTGKSLSLLSWTCSSSIAPGFRVFFTGLVLIYVSLCFFLGFFSLSVPLLTSFALYPHHSDVYALASAAIALCRCQFSLFYHYFTLLQLPDAFYSQIALSKLLGEMKTIPLLGTHFNNWMPVLVLGMAALTLCWKLFRKTRRNPDLIKEGKQVVDLSLRRMGMGESDLESEMMMMKKKAVYVYREVVYSKK